MCKACAEQAGWLERVYRSCKANAVPVPVDPPGDTRSADRRHIMRGVAGLQTGSIQEVPG